jgi:16S rRNA (guanine966-N2)-methyltransferase
VPRAKSTEGTSAGRVIAGTARGVRLAGPGEGTRPLGDRMKQSLFAILEPAIRGRRFLDLFAGSGAAGIEALSRGASKAVFVDWNERATETIERNLDSTGLAGERAVVSDVGAGAWLARETGLARIHHESAQGPFAAVLVDPPYDIPALLAETLTSIDDAGPNTVLAREGVVVAKHFWKTEVPATRLLASVRSERFGDTVLTFFRWAEEVDS